MRLLAIAHALDLVSEMLIDAETHETPGRRVDGLRKARIRLAMMRTWLADQDSLTKVSDESQRLPEGMSNSLPGRSTIAAPPPPSMRFSRAPTGGSLQTKSEKSRSCK